MIATMLRRVANLLDTKASTTAPLVGRNYSWGYSSGVSPERNPAQYASEAYRKNCIAYKAIAVVSRGVGSIPIEVRIKGKAVPPTHPLAQLLARPNPMQSAAIFFENMAGFYLIAGNTYVEGVGPDKRPPLELWALRPDRMKVRPGPLGVAGYIYEIGGSKKTWEVDPVSMASPILHCKTFSPLSDFYGQSPVEAAATAVDAHNEAGAWNQALLQNSARPSGALVYNPGNGSQLSDPQFERLKDELNEQYNGARNAGRPMLLDGGLSWQTLSLTPAEMDWLNGKHASAREIAMVFGVPPQVLGIPGDNTYSNFQEARQALYEDTIVPLHAMFCADIAAWLQPVFPGCEIVGNTDNLPAFAEKRAKRWNAVAGANWLTINEKREATGYARVEGQPEADAIMQPAGLIPLGDDFDDVETAEGK